ncbi:hypothetical protein FAGKG844_1060002 [Frankia sp. AgKG'84/4]
MAANLIAGKDGAARCGGPLLGDTRGTMASEPVPSVPTQSVPGTEQDGRLRTGTERMTVTASPGSLI